MPIFQERRGALHGRHDLLCFGASFPIPAASGLPRPFSNTQLTASVQIVAGMVSLLNDFHINGYGRPLGFLNTLLYRPATWIDSLKDIRSGWNPGCGTVGFEVAKGWDPVRPAALVSICHFRCWLTLSSILGHGSRDARL